MALPKLGCVNAVSSCLIYDGSGNVIAATIDTPNAIAYIFYLMPQATHCNYQFGGKNREDFTNRFNQFQKSEFRPESTDYLSSIKMMHKYMTDTMKAIGFSDIPELK